MRLIKSIRTKLCFTTATILILALFSTTVSAAPFSGYRMEGGIGNIYMYIDGNGSPQAT